MRVAGERLVLAVLPAESRGAVPSASLRKCGPVKSGPMTKRIAKKFKRIKKGSLFVKRSLLSLS